MPVLEIEGTWEQIAAHAADLKGQQLRLTVISAPSQEKTPVFREASGRSLLGHAGAWVGNDLEECLEIVRSTRSPTKFGPGLPDRSGN